MLMHNQLVGFGAGQPSPPLTFSAVASYDDTTNTTSTHTFSSCNIGTASADRIVIVTANIESTTATTITGGTINGVSATVAVTTTGSQGCAAVIYAAVPTGTTGVTIVVTISGGTSVACGISVYTITNYNSATPNSTDQATSESAASTSATVTVLTGGVGIFCNYSNNTSGGTSWTNATEFADRVMDATLTASSAYTQSNGAITATATHTTARSATAGAAWR